MPKMPATHNGGFIHSLTGKDSPVKAENENITESRRRMISPTKKADSKPAEAAPNAESSPIESTSDNSIRNSAGNVKKFRSRAFLRAGKAEPIEAGGKKRYNEHKKRFFRFNCEKTADGWA